MTDITLEQRAANALINARSQIGARRPDDADDAAWWDELTELAEALRLSAGEDWVLVPREPTPEMIEAAASFGGEGGYSSQRGSEAARSWRHMLAAAPRHEPGEGL